MSLQEKGRAYVAWPAAPVGAATTICLFTTHQRSTGGVVFPPSLMPGISQPDMRRIDAVEIVCLRNDVAGAANGLRLYALQSDGKTWTEVDCKDDNGAATIGSAANQTIPVVAAGAERRLLIDVSRYRGVAIDYTTGAGGPTSGIATWDGLIAVHLGYGNLLR